MVKNASDMSSILFCGSDCGVVGGNGKLAMVWWWGWWWGWWCGIISVVVVR